MRNPSLAKKSTDEAFNVGVNECRYCGRQGHYAADCYKKQSDRDKGIFRSNVSNPPKQTNGRGNGNAYRGSGRGRGLGRGRGGNFGRGRGHQQRRIDDSNAAFHDAADVDDLFFATEINEFDQIECDNDDDDPFNGIDDQDDIKTIDYVHIT